MTVDACGGYDWVWARVSCHNWGLGHAKEVGCGIHSHYRVVRCTGAKGKQQKTTLGEQGQGWTQQSLLRPVTTFWGTKAPGKNSKKRQKQKRNHPGNASTSKRHSHTCKNACMQRSIFAQKKILQTKKNTRQSTKHQNSTSTNIFTGKHKN